ncbi:MAG: hypothetical protein QM644_18355 [Mobilitalea sp.]
MFYVPDNYDAYLSYYRELDRQEKLNRRYELAEYLNEEEEEEC